MDYKKIILGVVIFVILIFLYYWIFNDAGKKTLFRLKDANQSVKIKDENVIPSAIYSWSFWVYVKEYTTNFSEKKNILKVTNNDITGTNKSNVEIYLAENVNDLKIELATGNKTAPVRKTIDVKRFPIQKWTHVLVSYRNRAVDVYIDGKIVKSEVIESPFIVPSKGKQEVYVNANTNSQSTDGYNGFLATMQYFRRAVQPEESYAIYKAGYNGGNWLSDLFNKLAAFCLYKEILFFEPEGLDLISLARPISPLFSQATSYVIPSGVSSKSSISGS